MRHTHNLKLNIRHDHNIKVLGVLKYVLGIKVVRSENGFFIIQQNYTLDIIDDSGAQGCRPCNFPMEQNLCSHGD